MDEEWKTLYCLTIVQEHIQNPLVFAKSKCVCPLLNRNAQLIEQKKYEPLDVRSKKETSKKKMQKNKIKEKWQIDKVYTEDEYSKIENFLQNIFSSMTFSSTDLPIYMLPETKGYNRWSHVVVIPVIQKGKRKPVLRIIFNKCKHSKMMKDTFIAVLHETGIL